MPSGKCRIKQQGMTIHLLEWPKSRKRQHQMLARMWSSRHSHSLLVGMQNGTVTLQEHLAVPHKTKHSLTVQSSNYDTGRSDQITGEKWEGAVGGVCQGYGKQSRTGLAEKLNVSRAHGIMGEKI